MVHFCLRRVMRSRINLRVFASRLAIRTCGSHLVTHCRPAVVVRIIHLRVTSGSSLNTSLRSNETAKAVHKNSRIKNQTGQRIQRTASQAFGQHIFFCELFSNLEAVGDFQLPHFSRDRHFIF